MKTISRKLLVVLAAMAVLVCALPMAFASAEATLIEGWQAVMLMDPAGNPAVPTVSQGEDGKLTFNAVGGGNTAMNLYLNGTDSSAENLANFPVDGTSDFTIEYDVEMTEMGPGGAEMGFAFNGMSMDYLRVSSIHLGLTNDHSCFWWNPYGDYGVPSDYTASVVNYPNGGYMGVCIADESVHHVTIEKVGNVLTFSMDDRDPVEIAYSTEHGAPESGYIGFFARNAAGTIANVVITNTDTEYTQTFFAPPAADDEGEEATLIEGWQAVMLMDPAGNPAVPTISQDENGKVHFNAVGGGHTAMSLYLNGDQSSAENLAKFPIDGTSDFTIEYDVELTEIGQGGAEIGFAFNGMSMDYLRASSIHLGHTNDHTCFWWNTYAGYANPYTSSYEAMEFPENAYAYQTIAYDYTIHRVTIQKVGNTLYCAMDDNVPIEIAAYSTEGGAPESGYMGFFARNAAGTIANVVITNNTGDEDVQAIFFGDGETDADLGDDDGEGEGSGDDNTGDDNTGDDNTGDDNGEGEGSGDNTGDDNGEGSGDKTEDDKTEDDKTEDDKTEDDKTEDDKTEDDKTEDDKTEDDKAPVTGETSFVLVAVLMAALAFVAVLSSKKQRA